MVRPIYRSQINGPLTCQNYDDNLDATLDRNNHTGTQLAETISDLAAAIDALSSIQQLKGCCTSLTAQLLALQESIFGEGELNNILTQFTQGLQDEINNLESEFAALQASLTSSNLNITSLQQNLAVLTTFAQTLNNKIIAMRIPASRVFVDSVNGNDSNNGLTPTTALKTITKAAEFLATKWIANGQMEIKLADGVYEGCGFQGTFAGATGFETNSQNQDGSLHITGNILFPDRVVVNHYVRTYQTIADPTNTVVSMRGFDFNSGIAIITGITFQYNPARVLPGKVVADIATIGAYNAFVYIDRCIFKALPFSGTDGNEYIGTRRPENILQPGGIADTFQFYSVQLSTIGIKNITIDGNDVTGFNANKLAFASHYSTVIFDSRGIVTLLNGPRYSTIFTCDFWSIIGVGWNSLLNKYSIYFQGDFGAREGQFTIHGLQGGTSIPVPVTVINRTVVVGLTFNVLFFPTEDSIYKLWPGNAVNVTKQPYQVSNAANPGLLFYDTRPNTTNVGTIVLI